MYKSFTKFTAALLCLTLTAAPLFAQPQKIKKKDVEIQDTLV